MDTEAVIMGDRTAFPIRFAAEAMGAKVFYQRAEYEYQIDAIHNIKICLPGVETQETR